MLDLKKFEQDIIKKYPQTTKIKNKNYHLKIPIMDDTVLNLNFKNYPKLPKASLVRCDGKTFNLDTVISSLRNWDKKHPPTILELIEEIILVIDSMISNRIVIKKELITGLMEMCITHHPKKVTGVLGVEKGIVSEYILPSRACTDPTKDMTIWGTPTCAIPLNLSYQGTFISRPEGDLSLNYKLKDVFKRRRFTLLIGFPYNDITCFKCFDTEGNAIKLSIVD